MPRLRLCAHILVDLTHHLVVQALERHTDQEGVCRLRFGPTVHLQARHTISYRAPPPLAHFANLPALSSTNLRQPRSRAQYFRRLACQAAIHIYDWPVGLRTLRHCRSRLKRESRVKHRTKSRHRSTFSVYSSILMQLGASPRSGQI